MAYYALPTKAKLWDKYYTGAPARQRRCVEQYNISQASLIRLAERYALNPKTVAKWKKRSFVHDAPMGPKAPRSTVLTPGQEAVCVTFRRHTLPPLDDFQVASRQVMKALSVLFSSPAATKFPARLALIALKRTLNSQGLWRFIKVQKHCSNPLKSMIHFTICFLGRRRFMSLATSFRF